MPAPQKIIDFVSWSIHCSRHWAGI